MFNPFRKIRISKRRGDVHKVRVIDAKYKGTYVSLWFKEPVPNCHKNTEIKGAPPYYVEFTWRQFFEPEDVVRKVLGWAKEHGVYDKLAPWCCTAHIKYFYQAKVDMVDGEKIKPAYMELWCEANYDLKADAVRVGLVPVKGEIAVMSGFPFYRWLPFRVVGTKSVHPFGFHIIILLSNFVYQYMVKTKEVWRYGVSGSAGGS